MAKQDGNALCKESTKALSLYNTSKLSKASVDWRLPSGLFIDVSASPLPQLPILPSPSARRVSLGQTAVARKTWWHDVPASDASRASRCQARLPHRNPHERCVPR